jgi:hypothetical protein
MGYESRLVCMSSNRLYESMGFRIRSRELQYEHTLDESKV